MLEEGDVLGPLEDDDGLELDFEILWERSPWRLERDGWLVTLTLATILRAQDAADRPRPLVTVSVFVMEVRRVA